MSRSLMAIVIIAGVSIVMAVLSNRHAKVERRTGCLTALIGYRYWELTAKGKVLRAVSTFLLWLAVAIGIFVSTISR
jgi:hypothetical protein